MDTDDLATGIVTALKSGGGIQVVIPRHIIVYLGIESRDKLKISVSKLGEKRPARRFDLTKNLKMIPKKVESKIEESKPSPKSEPKVEELDEAEEDFVEKYIVTNNHISQISETNNAKVQFGDDRVAELIEIAKERMKPKLPQNTQEVTV